MNNRPNPKDFKPLPDFSKPAPAEGKSELSSCCGGQGSSGSGEEEKGSCCGAGEGKVDYLLWGSLAVTVIALLGQWVWRPLVGPVPGLAMYFHHLSELIITMSWGIVAGILAIGLMSWIPRSWVARVLGCGGGFKGLLRATAAGLLLDLCNHGILMVGAQLYRKGATLGQTVAFLVASPWNSFSMTLILFALIGWKWALVFIVLSMVVALFSGWAIEWLVKRGTLPANPAAISRDEVHAPGWPEVKQRFASFKQENPRWKLALLKNSLSESTMVLRWIFFGAVLAAAIQAFVPTDTLATWFGPTWVGLLLTLGVTTVIEVCSEGSSPVAADLLNRGAAPGNAFTFLMAGAATDYTELMILREVTKSWKCALFLPLVAVPQIIVLGWLLNQV